MNNAKSVSVGNVVSPSRIWVVINEGQPEYSASYPEACHEHINDAIEQGITEAGRWVVREYVLS